MRHGSFRRGLPIIAKADDFAMSMSARAWPTPGDARWLACPAHRRKTGRFDL